LEQGGPPTKAALRRVVLKLPSTVLTKHANLNTGIISNSFHLVLGLKIPTKQQKKRNKKNYGVLSL